MEKKNHSVIINAPLNQEEIHFQKNQKDNRIIPVVQTQ